MEHAGLRRRVQSCFIGDQQRVAALVGQGPNLRCEEAKSGQDYIVAPGVKGDSWNAVESRLRHGRRRGSCSGTGGKPVAEERKDAAKQCNEPNTKDRQAQNGEEQVVPECFVRRQLIGHKGSERRDELRPQPEVPGIAREDRCLIDFAHRNSTFAPK